MVIMIKETTSSYIITILLLIYMLISAESAFLYIIYGMYSLTSLQYIYVSDPRSFNSASLQTMQQDIMHKL